MRAPKNMQSEARKAHIRTLRLFSPVAVVLFNLYWRGDVHRRGSCHILHFALPLHVMLRRLAQERSHQPFTGSSDQP